MIREDKLDSDQKDFVYNKVKASGNIWIQGFAGSGKSVLLIHSLLDVLKKEPSARTCIVVYTHSLIDMFETGMAELKFPKKIPVMTYLKFRISDEEYDYIFCDEVQDLPKYVVISMKNRCKKVIVAGDSNQSIYENTIEPEEIKSVLNAEPYTLNIIHRLSRSIISVVQSLFPSMNIWNAKRDNTKIDVEVRYCTASTKLNEVEYVWKEALKAVNVNDTAVILLPTHKKITSFINRLCEHLKKDAWVKTYNDYNKPDYNAMNSYFAKSGIRLEYVGNSYGSFQNAVNKKNVILMTYHSSKGMDFENVFIPFCSDDLNLNFTNSDAVFMVALTRSRKNLFISHTGKPYNLIKKIIDKCRHINIDTELKRSQTTTGAKFGF